MCLLLIRMEMEKEVKTWKQTSAFSLALVLISFRSFPLVNCAPSHLAGEHHGARQSGGHHHLHSQEKVHHAGHGHQSCSASLWANEVHATGRRHFSSFFAIKLAVQLGARPWSWRAGVSARQIKERLKIFISALSLLKCQASFIRLWLAIRLQLLQTKMYFFFLTVWLLF